MSTSRRQFLTSAAAGAALGVPLRAAAVNKTAKIAANDKIQIALIGCGGMGQADARSSVSTGMSKLVAACDCYDGRLEHMKELYGADIFTTKHYNEVLERKDIDAIIVGTPDHWHRQVSIDAMRAGKDVYCEKPMVQHIDDGSPVVEAYHANNRIMQVGSQRVSSVIYKKARDLYKSGAIGRLNMVEAWWDRNSADGAWQYMVPPDAGTDTCDWDTFQGRAKKTDWDPNRFFRWRCYQDYGTGVAGDLFVHLFSGLHFITGALGPNRVYASGGIRFWNDGRDVPDLLIGLYDYGETSEHPAFNLILHVNFESGAQESSGFRFIGSEGIMTVDERVSVTNAAPETEPGYTIGTFPESEKQNFLKAYHAKYPETKAAAETLKAGKNVDYYAPAHYSDHVDHHANFLKAVRSRKPVIEDPVFGFRAAGPALLSNISYFENRVVEWDPQTMKVKS